MNRAAIEINQLHFSYAENSGVVFKDFNLRIGEGERFGMLGPNGAGKTTLMNLMTGVLAANSGSISVLGHDISKDPMAAKRMFGFVPQNHCLYPELSPIENLEFFGAWAGLQQDEIKKRSAELFEVLGLSHAAQKQVSQFSGGMKSRLNLAIGVIHSPKILFLDEPTTGVDVQTRHAIMVYLKELNANGTTLIYTSHMLYEAEQLCTKIALLDHAKIIAMNDLQTLLRDSGRQNLEDLFLQLTGKNYRDS